MLNNKGASRRSFIKYITYAGGTLFVGGTGAYFLFKTHDAADEVRTRLESHIKGKIIKDTLLLEEYRTDFGKVKRKEPRIVVLSAGEADVVNTFKIANEFQVPVSLRGAGHSCFGQALSDGGILLVNNSANSEITVKNGIVTVSSDTQWLELEQHLNMMNLTSPVLTDYLELTVGGTLSVGGYGLRSFTYAGQIDNITEMEVILPDGSKVQCSDKKEKDIFRYALCGLGQLGLISKVSFKPIKLKKITIVFYIYLDTIDEFVSSFKLILETEFKNEIDHFSAYWDSAKFIFEIGKSFEDEDQVEYDNLSKKIAKNFKLYRKSVYHDYHLVIHKSRKEWVEQRGLSYHLWADYVFTIEQLRAFLVNIFTPKMINKHSDILPALYMVAGDCNKFENIRIPFSPWHRPENIMICGVGFYYMVKIGDTENLKVAKDQFLANIDSCIKIGGRPYLYGWHELSEKQKQHLYGNDYIKLRELKKKYDPGNIINPGTFLTGI